MRAKPLVMALYLAFLLLPIYWLVNMSLKTNIEIVSSPTLMATKFTPRIVTTRIATRTSRSVIARS